MLRDRIENAFLRVRRFGDVDWMDDVLAEVITSPDVPELAPAAAALIRKHGWFTPRNVEALSDGLANDSATWEWPIEESLRDLVSPAIGEIEPQAIPVDADVRKALERLHELETGVTLTRERANLSEMSEKVPAYETELAELGPGSDRAELERWFREYAHQKQYVNDLESGGEEARQQLIQEVTDARTSLESFAFTDTPEYERSLTRYAIATASKERYDLRQSLRVRADLRNDDLTIRNLLEREPIVEHLDHLDLATLIAVYGGYPNCRADRTDGEYADLEDFLSRSDSEREAIIDAEPDTYIGRFGNGDTIYTIAVFLDIGLMGRKTVAATPAQFTPSAIYRNSALDRLFVQWLQRAETPATRASELWQVWRTAPSLRAKADAIAALVALGEDVVPEIEAALSDANSRPFAEAALSNLARISEFLKDAVYRSRDVVLSDVRDLTDVEPATWIDIADTVLLEIARSSRAPVDFSSLLDSAPAAYRPVLEANQWLATFGAAGDRTKAIAKILDEIPNAGRLISLLASAHFAPLRRAARLSFHWELDPIPPRPLADTIDIPIETLAALDSLHLEDIRFDLQFAMQAAVLRKFVTPTLNAGELRPLLAAFAMKNGEFELAAELVPAIVARHGDPFKRILEAAREVSPYYRARTMAEVAPFFDRDTRRAILDEALRASDAIDDASRRARLLEMIVPIVAEDNRENLLARTANAAEQVSDPDQRARIFARLTRHSNATEALRLWSRTIESTAEIKDEDQRAETLALISGALPMDPFVRAQWQHVFDAIRLPRAQSRAMNTRGRFLLLTPPLLLTPKLAEHPGAWSPILLSAAVHETLARLRPEQSIRALWRSLAEGRVEDEIVTALLRSQSDQGLALTMDAARAIDVLVVAGQAEYLEMLLPLLQSPTHDALPYVERWRRQSNEVLARHANLLIAENGRQIDAQTVPALVACVANGADRSRCRAEIVFTSAVCGLEKAEPCLSVTKLGIAICDELARIGMAHEQSDIRVSRVCHHASADYVHDDPEILQTWIDRARDTRCGDKEATTNLRMILRLTDETWPVFLQGFIDGPKPLRLALLESLAGQFSIRSRIGSERQRDVLEALRACDLDEMADVLVLLNPEDRVAETAISIEKNRHPDHRDASRLANEALRATAIPLSDVLRRTDEALMAALAQIGDTFFRRIDGSEPESQFGAELIIENDTAFPLLLEWLTSTAERGEIPSLWFQKQKALLTVAARVVRRLPSVFAKHTDPARLEQPLVRIARFGKQANTRRAAITLLSYLRRVTRRTVDGLLAALQDDRRIQDAAFDAVQRLRVTSEMRAPLIRRLSSSSTVVATGAARMLSLVARQERTPADVRQEILSALIGTLRQRKSWNAIYRFTGTGKDSDDPIRISRLGSLEQELHRAVLDVAGLS